MAIEITIPRLGWSMEKGTFVEWLIKHGEAVSPGMALFSLEGEKAVQEIEAVDAGILHIPANGPQAGDVVPVGAVIAFLLNQNEAPPPLPAPKKTTARTPGLQKPQVVPAAQSKSPSGTPTVGTAAAAPSVRRLARELGVDWQSLGLTGSVSASDVRRAANQRSFSSIPVVTRNADRSVPRISPRAARTARIHGVDWTRLQGSGASGRIRERDVLAIVDSGMPAQTPELPKISGRLIPVSAVRKTIAERLQASAFEIVPVTLTTKLQANGLVALRAQWKSESGDVFPSYHDIIIYHVARMLKTEPALNACWWNGGIYAYNSVHIALAVETESGLFAPVIEQAETLSLLELAARTRELSQRAREGRLTQSQLSGGTFTVTNLGMFGIDAFTPVINPPQSAILGVGRIVDEPVVANGQVVAGKTLTLSLTFDHRVIDGAPAARWLQQLADALSKPQIASAGS